MVISSLLFPVLHLPDGNPHNSGCCWTGHLLPERNSKCSLLCMFSLVLVWGNRRHLQVLSSKLGYTVSRHNCILLSSTPAQQLCCTVCCFSICQPQQCYFLKDYEALLGVQALFLGIGNSKKKFLKSFWPHLLLILLQTTIWACNIIVPCCHHWCLEALPA